MTVDGGPEERDSPPPYPPMVPVAASGPVAPTLSWAYGLRPQAGEAAAAVRLAGLLLLSGLPLGVVWWLVAPRRAYLVGAEGAFAVVPESEAAVGSDGWFMALTGVVALAAAFVAWRVLRHRGPLVLLALAGGTLLSGLLTWFMGGLLGAGPTVAELADIGRTVHGPLQLRAHGSLTVAPFLAVAGYLIGACFTTRDDLGRPALPSTGGPAAERPL